jgi:hypothetical protein
MTCYAQVCILCMYYFDFGICLVSRRYKTISHKSHYIKGIHEVVRHIIGAQRGMGYKRYPALVRRDALLHVNLFYSDSYVKSFYSAWGRGRFGMQMARDCNLTNFKYLLYLLL